MTMTEVCVKEQEIEKHKKTINHTTKQLKTGLLLSVKEKDVENAYRSAFQACFGIKITSPFNVDGFLDCDTACSLLEFKFQHELKDKVNQCGILIQALFYIKKFAQAGKKIPTTIFIGDENECFVIPSSVLIKYLYYKIDWTAAPSTAVSSNPELLKEMLEDIDIVPFVFNVQKEEFNFETVIDKIKSLNVGVIIKVKITKENIVEIFNDFISRVLMGDLKDQGFAQKFSNDDLSQITTRQCDIFFNCLTDKETTYLHPKKKNCLATRGQNIKVNTNQYKSFFGHFADKLSPSELEVIVANKDRIIDEISRRKTGSFFTPTIWVNEAIKMLDEALGSDWREEYVVWDCASGTNNLTRDFQFKELYCSTLEQGDINTVKDCGYNKGSTVFQYDFLNDDEVDVLGAKVPEGLRRSFESGKKILFLINPPYGTANEFGMQGKEKSGTAKTRINKIMNKVGIGACSQQLYAQFMYRVCSFSKKYDVSIGIFAPPLFASGKSFSLLRKQWYDKFKFESGMLFQASNFTDVQGSWGIAFTIWKPGKTIGNNIILTTKTMNLDTFTIQKINEKMIYDPGDKQASQWVREALKGIKPIDSPQMKSAIAWNNKGRGSVVDGHLGYLANNANSVYDNATTVFLVSSCASRGSGLPVIKNNFDRVVSLFCARKSIGVEWFNSKDEYLIPNEQHPDYKQWNTDAIVYSLFNNSSQQSALRDINYKGKKWNIQNTFFFMSNKEMRELADKAGFMEMYEDAKSFPNDSYVYTLLQSTKLSDDTKAILENAKDLMKQSMSLREAYAQEHPELHLKSWNAGWAQLKPLLKQHFKPQYDAFVVRYKAFESRMREGVYKFGFLK